MKNDLTAEEWLKLNKYLQFGVTAFNCSKDIEIFKSAKEKIKQTAKEIRSHGKK